MPRYDDCLSCAFFRREDAICDVCDDADQWEPSDDCDGSSVGTDITSIGIAPYHIELKRVA